MIDITIDMSRGSEAELYCVRIIKLCLRHFQWRQRGMESCSTIPPLEVAACRLIMNLNKVKEMASW